MTLCIAQGYCEELTLGMCSMSLISHLNHSVEGGTRDEIKGEFPLVGRMLETI